MTQLPSDPKKQTVNGSSDPSSKVIPLEQRTSVFSYPPSPGLSFSEPITLKRSLVIQKYPKSLELLVFLRLLLLKIQSRAK
jgi:hypothetical protein